jgi:hypothetical protein
MARTILRLMDGTRHRSGLAPQGRVGLVLVAVCWPLNWCLPGVRTAYLFFPLWLGYALVVDALVQRRTGSSLWNRSPREFVLLFVTSSPVWWLFEAFNARTRNWEYLGADRFSAWQYYLLCTINFSTVMPAVFETAAWVRSWGWVDRLSLGARLAATGRLRAGLLLGGLMLLALTLLWPASCYAFVWISVLLILEPVNWRLGRPTLLRWLDRGDWRPVLSLALGGLICGFFWEMWNYWAYPKWIYHTPGVGFLHLFEMPLLGYGGYVPFSLELYALNHLLRRNAQPLPA